jgi:hypothetical protein
MGDPPSAELGAGAEVSIGVQLSFHREPTNFGVAAAITFGGGAATAGSPRESRSFRLTVDPPRDRGRASRPSWVAAMHDSWSADRDFGSAISGNCVRRHGPALPALARVF